MTRIHHLHGIECTYPENWQLSEDREDQQFASFTLQSPHTAFMSVYISRNGGQPDELIKEMTDMLSAEYDGVETAPVDAETLAVLQPCVKELQAVDLNFYFLDLLVTARLIAYAEEKCAVLIQCQAEDREFDALEKVFQAMMISMVRSKK